MNTTGVPFNEIAIDAAEIRDWSSFHATFARVFGFPELYGHNMNAWIDCMTDLDDPDSGMTKIHAPPNGILVLKVLNAKDLAKRCPELFGALNDCAAFVNWRRREMGSAPVLALSYHD